MTNFKKIIRRLDEGPKYSLLGIKLTKAQWYVAAPAAGAVALAPLGGFGVAAFGGAVGVGWWAVGAVAGGLAARDRLKDK